MEQLTTYFDKQNVLMIEEMHVKSQVKEIYGPTQMHSYDRP